MTDIVRDPYGNPLKRDATITILRTEVERLTAERDRQYDQNAEQITRIAALEAENEKLRVALEKLSCKCPSNCDWEKHGDICPSWVARAALEEKPND